MKQKADASKKDHILTYFKAQWRVLLAVTFSGLIYNVGLLVGPWCEGQMTGCLGGHSGWEGRIPGYAGAGDRICDIYCHRADLPLY